MSNDLQIDAYDILRVTTTSFFFNSLVIEITNLCNSTCEICYQTAGPSKASSHLNLQLSKDIVKKIIREAATIPNLEKRLHLAGGEAFLFMDQCVDLFEYAKESGFIDLTATTNGFWAKDLRKGLEYACNLKKAGVTSLELSADYWHQLHIGSEAISNCIDVCKEAGITINLRLLATHHHHHVEAIKALRPSSIEKVDRITCGKVFLVGRAENALPPDECYQGGAHGKCYGVLNLTVNASGNVYPCCAGFEQTNQLIFGNIKNDSIVKIARTIEESEIFRAIAFLGISYFLPILKDSGIPIRTVNDYGNMCALCWNIFSQPEAVKAIVSYFNGLGRTAIERAISYLETQIQLTDNQKAI